MKLIRQVAAVILLGGLSFFWVEGRTVSGTEPTPAKPEAIPTPSPQPSSGSPTMPPKTRVQENESKAATKAPVTPPQSENAGKESVPAKSEAASPPAAPKPPASKSPSNGSAASKSTAVPQPPLEIIGNDGAPMVLIPVGEFTMGSDKGDDDEQPIHRVFLDNYYIDKFEVTNRRFAKFVKAMLLEPPWGFADKDTPIVHADRPVRWVNWWEALGYCLWVGKRLPTEAEWEKAARGSDARTYPWGNDPPTSAHAVFGLKEGTDTVSPIGNRDAGKSPYGVHDMAGNLYEWTTDWYDDRYYTDLTAINPRGPLQGMAKAQRGGSYTNSPYRLRSTFRTKGDPLEHEHNVGFRCAQDAPK